MQVRTIITNVAIIGAVLAGPRVSAQDTGRIVGTVTDFLTGEPIPEAPVHVIRTTTVVPTDTEGRFQVTVIPGLVRLSVRVLGYHPIATGYYTILPNTTNEINFKLTALSYDAGQVTEFRAANRDLSAHVLTKSDLPDSADLVTALKAVLGDVVTIGYRDHEQRIALFTPAEFLYWIDGKIVYPPLETTIGLDEVECVEVRFGYEAPRQFANIKDFSYVGMILIWTPNSRNPLPSKCASVR